MKSKMVLKSVTLLKLLLVLTVSIALSSCATAQKKVEISIHPIEKTDIYTIPAGTIITIPAGTKIIEDKEIVAEWPTETIWEADKTGWFLSDHYFKTVIEIKEIQR